MSCKEMNDFVEIERKFLIHSLPDAVSSYPHRQIIQGYIECRDESVEVRLRQDGNCYVQTIKNGSGVKRLEVNIPINEAQFFALWPLTAGKRLEKTRYEIDVDSYLIELDVYGGQNTGLVTAEVEFAGIEEAAQFSPPDWFGQDITKHLAYKNRWLAS